jgi:hypothetical protein
MLTVIIGYKGDEVDAGAKFKFGSSITFTLHQALIEV